MGDDDTLPVVAWRDARDATAAEDLPVDLEWLSGLLAAALARLDIPSDAEASLQLAAEDVMADLNVENMGGSGPTDVLSFPIDGADGPSSMGEDWIVGDVVVCPEVARAQAADHAGDLDSELALLVVHAALHLCGWDHATPDEQSAMWALERELMDALGCSPSRDPWVAAEAERGASS